MECVWVAWVTCVSLTSLCICMSLYLRECTCVTWVVYIHTYVREEERSEASEPHEIAQGYHVPFLLQETRLAHAVRPRGMEDVVATPHDARGGSFI